MPLNPSADEWAALFAVAERERFSPITLSRLAFTRDEWTTLNGVGKEDQFPLVMNVSDFPPIRLTTKELEALEAADERNYVLTIREDIVKDRPDLADDPALLDRLNAAYDEAKRIGFTNDQHIVAFLWLDSVDPGFYKRPAVSRWLTKKGTTPEQRFDMLIDVARSKTNINGDK